MGHIQGYWCFECFRLDVKPLMIIRQMKWKPFFITFSNSTHVVPIPAKVPVGKNCRNPHKRVSVKITAEIVSQGITPLQHRKTFPKKKTFSEKAEDVFELIQN